MMYDRLLILNANDEIFAEIRSILQKHGFYDTPSDTRTDTAIDARLAAIFISVGIPPHISGYKFLRESVKLAVKRPDVLNSITKGLYPKIAEIFSTAPAKVERAMRHAIGVAWERGKLENLDSIFGMTVFDPLYKPTNGEFIALLADKLLLENY